MSERTETALRDAIDAFTDRLDAAPDAWEQIERRIEARGGRRSRPVAALVGALVLVTTIALVVVLVAALREDGTTSGPAASTPMPERIVSVIDGNLVVLDAENGNIVRTLTGAGQPGDPSVGADGFVYFSRHPTQCEIARVRLSGGRPEVVGHGVFAEVSPNGRWLAIIKGATGPCDGQVQLLEIFDPRGRQAAHEIQVVTGGGSTFEFLGWSPDSRQALVRTVPEGNDYPTTYEVDLLGRRGSVFLAAGPGIPTTYLGATGLLVEAGSSLDRQFTIAAFDPVTGERQRRLVPWSDGSVSNLATDPSGRHLLYWVFRGQRTLQLWRRSAGEEPVLLRTEVAYSSGGLPAVWVP